MSDATERPPLTGAGVMDLDKLRAWAEFWRGYGEDLARQVAHLFEEWDYRVREATELEAVNRDLLEACKAAVTLDLITDPNERRRVVVQIMAAIAKAEPEA